MGGPEALGMNALRLCAVTRFVVPRSPQREADDEAEAVAGATTAVDQAVPRLRIVPFLHPALRAEREEDNLVVPARGRPRAAAVLLVEADVLGSCKCGSKAH